MNLETHNKYFRDIDYNTNTKFSWEGHTDNFIQGLKVYYDLRIESMLSKCVHLTVIEDLAQLKGLYYSKYCTYYVQNMSVESCYY